MRLCWPSPRRVAVFVGILLLVAATAAAPAIARDWHDRHRHSDHHGRGHHSSHHHSGHSSSHRYYDWDDSDHDDDGDEITVVPDQPVDEGDNTAGGTVLTGNEQTITVELTGYGAPDNNPAGSKTISQPVIHHEAGGTCTFADPVTFASPGSAGSTEFPKGQRVYVPKLKCYAISEDSGATKMSMKHIDIYTGDGPKRITDKCESDLTGKTTIIVNPKAGKPVNTGPLSTSSGCSFTSE